MVQDRSLAPVAKKLDVNDEWIEVRTHVETEMRRVVDWWHFVVEYDQSRARGTRASMRKAHSIPATVQAIPNHVKEI